LYDHLVKRSATFPQGWNAASLQYEDQRRNPLRQTTAIFELTPFAALAMSAITTSG
jgi:hypothetical protein